MEPINRSQLSPAVQATLLEVESALDLSYCPYSGLCVGAGFLLQDGGTVIGVNYESASYGLTLCAERAALARAQAEGSASRISGLVLAAKRKAGPTHEPPLTPCGACRQWLAELSERLGRDFPVFTFWAQGEQGMEGTARQLLPDAFK